VSNAVELSDRFDAHGVGTGASRKEQAGAFLQCCDVFDGTLDTKVAAHNHKDFGHRHDLIKLFDGLGFLDLRHNGQRSLAPVQGDAENLDISRGVDERQSDVVNARVGQEIGA
jgi:hypothetical protein